VIHLADEHPGGTSLDLRVAAEAEVGVALDEHAAVHPAVRLVACHAALAQCFVLEHVRRGLFRMALDANGVALLQPQAASGLVDIPAVRLVAIDTGHAPLEHAMMVRHGELAVCGNVALEAGQRVVARVHDVRRQAGPDVFAASAVARFAAGHRCPVDIVAAIKTTVRTAGEVAMNFLVTLRTGLVADERRPGNLRRRGQSERRALGGGAGNKDGTNEGEAQQRREIQKPTKRSSEPVGLCFHR